MKYFILKNNLKNFIKLVFVLILFAVSFSFRNVYAATITYETYGGGAISSDTVDDNETIGIMPVPTKSGNIFVGWYLEDTYDTKVTNSYVVTGDVTLHAKWENENFPIIWKKIRECIFNGKDHNISGDDCTEYSNGKYIDTGIMLYDNTNHGLDYEIGFKIEHYDPNEQDENIPQQTFMNTKLEGTNYPGLVFRRNGDKVELASRRTTSANSSHQEKYEDWTDVRIYRIDKTIYYSVNEVEKHDLNGLYTFNPEFELNVWFGAAPKNVDATVAQRFLNGTLSNMYIKVGNYEEKDNYKVYKPDGTIDEVEKYSDYSLENVDYTKNYEKLATVTFDYHNGNPSTEDYVKKQYIGNGWTIYDTHFDDDEEFRVLTDTVLYPEYVESTVGATFPSDPEREGYEFVGWYTLEDGGELVTSYNETSNITLHAHYEEIYSPELESNTYIVEDINNNRVVIGLEPETLISDFKDQMTNPNEQLKVFDNGVEVSDSSILKTGLTVKLIIDGTAYDEATIIIKGDVNGDGYINIIDKLKTIDSIKGTTPIIELNDYAKFYAADIDENSSINDIDSNKITDFDIENISSLKL